MGKNNVVNNYGSFDVTFVRGKNATLWDTDGKKYIDFMAGIGVNSLGHANKNLVAAIQSQAEKQIHISNYYLSDVGVEYAEELLRYTGFDGVYFGNSGAEANEAAFKLARKFGHLNGGTKRRVIYTLENSFHGRTLATLTATGQEKFHPECFAPYVECFKTIRANDFDAIKTAFDETTAALMIECVQGEGGVNLIDTEWAKAVAAAARKVGAIVMADEVQTGVGRTGAFLASDALGFEPDVVTLAKGIAGGIPMGACLFRNKAANVFVANDHQSTFAGNPLACSAALVVLRAMQKKEFFERVNFVGEKIRSEIKSWNCDVVQEVRGKGLMIGIQIKPQAKPSEIQVECLKKGLCVCTAGADVVRFLPPLTISDDEIEEGLAIFKSVIKG